jgi:hypothetical protein
VARYQAEVQAALRTEYREIFLITAAISLAAAGLALAVGRRREREQVLEPARATR